MYDSSDPTLSVRLVGPDEDLGEVRFEDFRTFCVKLADCLHRAEAIVTHHAGKIRYRIVGLEGGSAFMQLAPVASNKKTRDQRAEVLAFFKQTISGLEAGTSYDPRLTLDDLSEFRDLVADLRRTKEIWIDNERLTSQYVANIDKILGAPIQSEGSVSGFLEGLNVHQKNEFILYPPIAGYRISCVFPPEMFELVRSALKRNVTVTGTLHHHPDRPFPDRVRVKEMEIQPPDSELPTLRELRGVFRGCTGNVGAAKFVRTLRDEQES